MKFREAGFRAFYRQFTAVPLKDSLREVLRDFPEADRADHILTFGYADPERGLTLEVLAAARKTEKGFLFAEGNDAVRSFIRIDAVAEEEAYWFDDAEGDLAGRFAEKLEGLHAYDASEEVEKTRQMRFLDESRDEICIDDVLVWLRKDGLFEEGCHVRITDLSENCFIGRLLEEPEQDFGYHAGETIAFFLEEREDGKIVCWSDMNPSRRITEEDLEDGSLLEQAVTAFGEHHDTEHFLEVLELLRDSIVWVPCTAIFSEADQKRLDEMVLGREDDLDSLIGEELVIYDETRLVPDILQKEEEYFFPVFSTEEAMGEYGTHFSHIPASLPDVIGLARNNSRKLSGIVLNAFTEPFVLDAEIWDIAENMKPRILS